MSPTTALDRAAEVKDVVRALKGFGLTQKDLADATGASDRSVRAWATTSAISPANESRLQAVREVVLILKDSLTDRGVGQWMRAKNRLLDGQRAIDLIAKGRVDDVRKAAESYIDGAYI